MLKRIPFKEEHHQEVFKMFQKVVKNYTRNFEDFKKNETKLSDKLERVSYVLFDGEDLVGFIRSFNHFFHAEDLKVVFFQAYEKYQGDLLIPFLKELIEETIKPGQKICAGEFEDVSWRVNIFKKLGMKEESRMWRSYFDLVSNDIESVDHPYKLLTLADLEAREDGLKQIYELEKAITKDIPMERSWPGITYSEFLELHNSADKAKNASIYYEDQGRLIAKSTAGYEGDDSAHIFLTGSLREYRKQGLATKLKLESMKRLKAEGKTRLYTMNDSQNAPMLRINEKLGFVREGNAKTFFVEA